MDSILYNTGLTAVIAQDLSVKSSHLLDPLSNKKIGVLSLEQSGCGFGGSDGGQNNACHVLNASSRPHTLIQETNRAAAVDPEGGYRCSLPQPILVSLSLRVGSYWVSNQLPPTDRTPTAKAREE